MMDGALSPKGRRTRQALIDQAVERFGRDGFNGTSIAAIARDVGVSRSLAYAYFDDGKALFDAALDHDLTSLIEEGLNPFITSHLDDLSWRDNVIAELVETLDAHPLAHRVIAGLEPTASSDVLGFPAMDDLRANIAELLGAGQDVGLLRSDIDVELMGRAVVTIWAMALITATQFGLDGLERELASIRTLIEAALVGRSCAERDQQPFSAAGPPVPTPRCGDHSNDEVSTGRPHRHDR